MAWADAGGHVHDRGQASPADWPGGARAIWVDVNLDTEADALESVLGRVTEHRAALAARIVHHERRRPSLLLYPDAVTFRVDTIRWESDGRDPSIITDSAQTVHVVVNQHVLVTAHAVESHILELAWEECRRGQSIADGIEMAVFQLLDAAVSDWGRMRGHMVAYYEDIQADMLLHPYRNLAPRILSARRSLLAFNRVLRPESEIFTLLSSDKFRFVRDSQRPYFQDVADRMQDVVDEVEATREGLSGTVEAYTSMQSNEINKVMKLLTIISVLALPATTIASIYGMNFNIPELKWPFGYWYSLALMASVTLTLLWWVRRHQGFR
jgi:magnesium transporter